MALARARADWRWLAERVGVSWRRSACFVEETAAVWGARDDTREDSSQPAESASTFNHRRDLPETGYIHEGVVFRVLKG